MAGPVRLCRRLGGLKRRLPRGSAGGGDPRWNSGHRSVALSSGISARWGIAELSKWISDPWTLSDDRS